MTESFGRRKYLVKIRNTILGNSDHIMTKEEIKNFSIVAYELSNYVDLHRKVHTSGMWSVEEYKD